MILLNQRTSHVLIGSLFVFAACANSSALYAQVINLPPVEIRSGRPTSIPSNIPTTTEGIDAKTIDATINATDSSDALKYFPSLLVRKRFIGDFDHAVLATRASGTGNSARSLVYADGVLLSNLLGNGASFTPRWGLVTPEEIERVDVLYGPFSAAYSGNSVGAVVDYVTRMPTQLTTHAKLSFYTQPSTLFGQKYEFSGGQISGSIGSAAGPWSWWVNASHHDTSGQPLALANRLQSQGVVSTGGTRVTGFIADKDPRNRDWFILGSNTQIRTIQDHAKIKLAYDLSSTLRLSYTLGLWKNDATRSAATFLKDSTGAAVYSGDVNIEGRRYTLAPADFALAKNELGHRAQGLNLKSNTKGVFDWGIALSQYTYGKDITKSSTTALPLAQSGGAGRIADQRGTGWTTFDLRATWRPKVISKGTDPDASLGNLATTHVIDVGIQRDSFALRSLVSNTDNWLDGQAQGRFSAFAGNTVLSSAYVQDTWRTRNGLRGSLGLRFEDWSASNGSLANQTASLTFAPRKQQAWSPKAALAYNVNESLTIKSSVGRAVRFATVSELFQGSITSNLIVNNDPNLRPERSVTAELTADYKTDLASIRATIFSEKTRDALYSQTNLTVTPNVTNIQNVDRIRTVGFELSGEVNKTGIDGLTFGASATYADSTIAANAKFPGSVDKRQPRVPNWRANLVARYQPNDVWDVSLGLRYSGRQYGTLDNIDVNDKTYTSVSRFLVADIRGRTKINANWSIAAGIDNVNNAKYWAFHPYPQRTFHTELRFN